MHWQEVVLSIKLSHKCILLVALKEKLKAVSITEEGFH
jgi:hypothetical protein